MLLKWEEFCNENIPILHWCISVALQETFAINEIKKKKYL